MSIKHPQEKKIRSLAFGAWVAVIVLLRLVIWKFFPGAETMVKEDLSNLIVAALQLSGAAVFIVLVHRQREALFSTGFEWPLGALFVVSAATLFYSVDFSISLRVWLALVGSMAMFYMLTLSLTESRMVKWFLFFILACALVTSLFGIQEFFMLSSRQPQSGDKDIATYNNSLYYILTHRRVTSFLGWPNSLAGYLLLIFPFSGLSILMVRRVWLKCLLGLVFAVLAGCLLVTFSFLGWLSFFCSTVIMLPVVLKRFLPHMDARFKAVAFILAAVLISFFVMVIVRKDFAGSMLPRKEYYLQTVNLLKVQPWWGYGYGAFGMAARPMVESVNGFTNYVHNAYLQWWVECGIMGLIGILSLVGVFIAGSRRVLDHFKEGEGSFLALAVVWGLTAFFIDNLFSFTFIKPNIAVHGWAMLAVFAALLRQTKPVAARPSHFISVSAGFLVCVGSLVVTGMLGIALFYLHSGMISLRNGDIDTAGRSFVRGSLIDRWSASYPFAAGDAAVRVYQMSGKESHLRLAEDNYVEAVRREPLQYSAHLILSRVYTALGENSKALSYAREAKRLSPYEYTRDMSLIMQRAPAR